MHQIKFSHLYAKMPMFPEKAKTWLMGVELWDSSNLPELFVVYDTLYNTEEFYPLPKGKVLVLFLYTESGTVWTTVRRYTPRKETYYRSLVGQQVQITINEETNV